MYLKYINNYISKKMSEEIQDITNKSKVKIDDIKYDEKTATVVIVASLKNDKIFSTSNKIVISLNEIKSVKIENNTDTISDEITLLFGIRIENKSIYFSSAEESLGILMFEMELICNQYNIEIKDLN